MRVIFRVLKRAVARVPILRSVLARGRRMQPPGLRNGERFPGSAAYWDMRYSRGCDSGPGSGGVLAEFKADVINSFVDAHCVRTVVEFGCGDGRQLSLARYPQYAGFDVSASAIDLCKRMFGGDERKSFSLMREYTGQLAELALSLDVIYHLVEDDVFDHYMRTLFGASTKYVIIYSSNFESGKGDCEHVRHREFTAWVGAHMRMWHLVGRVSNRHPYLGDDRKGSFAEFFIYRRVCPTESPTQ